MGWRGHKTSSKDIAFFPVNGFVFGLFPRAELAKDVGILDDGSGFRGVTLAYNARSKAEVDTVIADAERAGGRIVKKPHDTFWGGYSGYFADPDSHLWEVAFNPHWNIRHDGTVDMDTKQQK
jgi:catechol 2,3-dioxygenase-like lactoylglutathione lyase family enzyme